MMDYVPCPACDKLLPFVVESIGFDDCGRSVTFLNCDDCEKAICVEVEVYELPEECMRQ